MRLFGLLEADSELCVQQGFLANENWSEFFFMLLDSKSLLFLFLILIYDFISRKGNKSKAPWLLMVTEDGFGKRVPIKAFPKGVAGRVGVIGCKVSIIVMIHLSILRKFALSSYLCVINFICPRVDSKQFRLQRESSGVISGDLFLLPNLYDFKSLPILNESRFSSLLYQVSRIKRYLYYAKK
jgi:hypothetical protein